MTEDEARRKWCPMVRTGLTAGMAVNHHVGSRHDSPQAGDVHDETRCIASDCMMWRWGTETGWPDGVPQTLGNLTNMVSSINGRCGLAGQ